MRNSFACLKGAAYTSGQTHFGIAITEDKVMSNDNAYTEYFLTWLRQEADRKGHDRLQMIKALDIPEASFRKIESGMLLPDYWPVTWLVSMSRYLHAPPLMILLACELIKQDKNLRIYAPRNLPDRYTNKTAGWDGGYH